LYEVTPEKEEVGKLEIAEKQHKEEAILEVEFPGLPALEELIQRMGSKVLGATEAD
jgi:hypothetical protein